LEMIANRLGKRKGRKLKSTTNKAGKKTQGKKKKILITQEGAFLSGKE